MGHVRTCDGPDGKGCGKPTRVIVVIDGGANLRDLCIDHFVADQAKYLDKKNPP